MDPARGGDGRAIYLEGINGPGRTAVVRPPHGSGRVAHARRETGTVDFYPGRFLRRLHRGQTQINIVRIFEPRIVYVRRHCEHLARTASSLTSFLCSTTRADRHRMGPSEHNGPRTAAMPPRCPYSWGPIIGTATGRLLRHPASPQLAQGLNGSYRLMIGRRKPWRGEIRPKHKESHGSFLRWTVYNFPTGRKGYCNV